MGATKGIGALVEALNSELFDYRATLAVVIGSLTVVKDNSDSPAIKEILTEDIGMLEAIITGRDA